MPIVIDVRHNLHTARRDLRGLSKHIQDKAIVATLNKAGDQGITVARRAVAQATGLRVGDVRKTFSGRVRSTKGRLVYTIRFFGGSLNLARFRARQGRKGIVARAWGVTKTYPGTFLAKNGRTAFRRAGPDRLPIVPVHGPSIVREAAKKEITELVNRKVAEVIERVLPQQVARFKAKRGRVQ